jgi:hypothetical protein
MDPVAFRRSLNLPIPEIRNISFLIQKLKSSYVDRGVPESVRAVSMSCCQSSSRCCGDFSGRITILGHALMPSAATADCLTAVFLQALVAGVVRLMRPEGRQRLVVIRPNFRQ